jgi:IS4 transposase
MSQQDRKSPQQQIVVNHESLKKVIAWLLPTTLFAGMHVREGSKWKPRMLAAAALLWAASDHPTLGERFDHVRKIIKRIFRRQAEPGQTYRGFMKMLNKWHAELLLRVVGELRLRMEQELAGQFQVAGFTVFAGDGSRVATPRTKSNQRAFSPQRKQKKKSKRGKSPRACKRKTPASQRRKTKKQSAASIEKKADMTQIWLTLLWHVGTGLPWSWRSGAADSSERHHLREMLGEVPKNSLITADAGFVGYDFWKEIHDAGHDFVIRVGANVKLIKQLGYAREYDHTVYLWPDKAAKKKLPPLVLRLIVIHDGKQPVYLVTSATKTELSDKQAIEIYRHRWGIELFFRTFKQTFGRTKLRSRAGENAKLELDWSLVALWSICLLGQRELVRAGEAPSQLSAAAAIKAVQTTLRDYRVRPESPEEILFSMLAAARLDGYERSSSKASRDYPKKKQRERIAAPKIARALKQQITAAKVVKTMQA